MYQGLRTAIYKVNDVQKAKEWYTKVLGFPPYFDQPYYVGFNVAGFELGLDPDTTGVKQGTNVVVYWGVEDAKVELKRLLSLGATLHQDLTDVGEGILLATVLDPFGNIFGIITNPHFKLSEK